MINIKEELFPQDCGGQPKGIQGIINALDGIPSILRGNIWNIETRNLEGLVEDAKKASSFF